MPAPRMEAASFFEARKKDTADSLLGAQNTFKMQFVHNLNQFTNSLSVVAKVCNA